MDELEKAQGLSPPQPPLSKTFSLRKSVCAVTVNSETSDWPPITSNIIMKQNKVNAGHRGLPSFTEKVPYFKHHFNELWGTFL